MLLFLRVHAMYFRKIKTINEIGLNICRLKNKKTLNLTLPCLRKYLNYRIFVTC